MRKFKLHMPKELEDMPEELKKKCHAAIHTATAASAAAGAIPIPMSDAIPITAAQISMIISLGRAFGITLSETAAKSIIGVGLTQQAGRTVVSGLLKMIPGAGTLVGGMIGASTAAAMTEALGWVIVSDFYRMSQGKEPENIVENASGLKDAFNGLRFSKKN